MFCCPGQGGQWLGMGRDLLLREAVFSSALAQCDAAIQAVAGWSVIDRLRSPTCELDRIDVVQPLLFSLAIAYAALWRSWGIEPDAHIGHSMGEVAAAVLAGRLTLEDGATVIVRRSALMQGLPSGGAMLAVDLSGDEILARYPNIALAAENGPSASVVAGGREVIEALSADLDLRGIRWRKIAVEVASHSAAVEVLDEPLSRALEKLSPQSGTLAMYSTVEGRRLDAHERLDAEYWRRNLRQTVRLWPAIQAAVDDAHAVFIELGPHPVLLPAIREGLDVLGVRGLTIASGKRDADEQLELCRSLAALYEAGIEIDWDAVYPGARLDAPLPGYPFQRKAYWLPTREHAPTGTHPFLGTRVELAHTGGATQVWTGSATIDAAGFIREHLVEHTCVLPGMASVDLVLTALADGELREISFERAIVLQEGEATELQLRVDRDGAFELWGRSDREWTRRVHGRVAALRDAGPSLDLAAQRERCRPTHDRASFYGSINRGGNLWGPSFAGVEAIFRDGDQLLADLSLPPSIAGELWRHRFHPALLDACAQAMLSVALRERGSLVLAEIGRIAIYGDADRARASWISIDAQQHAGSLRADVVVVDEAGVRVLEIEGLRVQFLHERQGGWLHASAWRAVAPAKPNPASTRRLSDIVHVVESTTTDASAAAQLDATVHACLAAIQSSSAERLWLVTRGATSPDGHCDPLQAAVWGLGRVMQVELGRRFVRAIDLDPDPTLTPAQLTQALDEELLIEDGHLEIAHRAGQRLAPRLEALTSIRGHTSPLANIDPDEAVLITGGLGGLGLRMAEHLMGRGARHMVLMGRTSPSERQLETIHALEARGAEVHVVALDVADEPALRAWSQRWTDERRPPIHVIVHAAGVQHPRALSELGEPELRADLRAKVAGAIALERVFADQLACLLLFSSAATLLPSPLLGAYTAANAFLEGLATKSRAAGRPTTAIAWGLLGEGGMAQRHAHTGGRLDAFTQMDPSVAFDMIDRILAAELGCVGVLAIDWPAWLRAHPQLAATPYFEALREPIDAPANEPLEPPKKLDDLDAYLRAQLARVLRLPDPAQIDIHAPLTSLGLDSLMALELRNRVESETGAAPAVVELLRGISLARLIELIDAQLRAPKDPPEWEELTL